VSVIVLPPGLQVTAKVDLLLMAQSRPEFTAASIAALKKNTEWDRVQSIRLYWNGRVCEETARIMARWSLEIPMRMRVDFEPHFKGGPVDGMLDTLANPGAPIIAKIDNDVIVPPGWLNHALGVMDWCPDLDLLGLEPPLSRTPAPWDVGGKRRRFVPEDACSLNFGYAPCDAIGGVGLFRRRAFDGRPKMKPHSIYGGFTDWQLEQKDVVKGWIMPPMNLFLLDRLPIEPWATLSKKYIAQGFQRAWTGYPPESSELWDWWLRDYPVTNGDTDHREVQN